jgi:hypothetical protein
MENPGKNNIFVGSRSGGPMEQSRTKQTSMKHENPEYFKRQADRKNSDSMNKVKDGGPGSGPQEGGQTMTRSQQIIANREKQAKEKALENTKNILSGNKIAAEKHAALLQSRKKYGGKDSVGKKDNIPARKDVPIQRDFNHRQPNIGKDPGRGTGQVGRDSAPSAMKQFAKGTMY